MCVPTGLVYVVLGFQLNYIASPEKGVVALFLVIACLGYKKTSLLSETFLGVTCFMTSSLIDSPGQCGSINTNLFFTNHSTILGNFLKLGSHVAHADLKYCVAEDDFEFLTLLSYLLSAKVVGMCPRSQFNSLLGANPGFMYARQALHPYPKV